MTLLATPLLFASAFAFAAEDLCPFPVGMQASVGASKEAIAAKNAGVSKADLLKTIPKENELSRLLTEIVQEVYDYPTLPPEIYGAYRFEQCFLAQNHPKRIAAVKFSKIYPLLEKCQLISQEGARPPCAMKAIHAVSGIPE